LPRCHCEERFTNEAVDDLGLKVGDEAIAIIKASDVMVAK
jgi:molybdopterin-binding protein